MRVLIVCDYGLNRSVHLAGQLRFMGHDCLTIGLRTNSLETIQMLVAWAERIILTAGDQHIDAANPAELRQLIAQLGERVVQTPHGALDVSAGARTELWNIGPDKFPRPFNRRLLRIVRRLISEHPDMGNPAETP